ncbi:hypothetical protein GIB67_006136 [Kingdonia uniflora]|uniref:Protein kinase domain-containing protein n=1 Tax=Kingdonia uniflora TaxID=39325 RepID=A0A7J7LQ63_9MAGN|nr:hypothetical protein GIB67_006136 [Kingdonia uniflora]
MDFRHPHSQRLTFYLFIFLCFFSLLRRKKSSRDSMPVDIASVKGPLEVELAIGEAKDEINNHGRNSTNNNSKMVVFGNASSNNFNLEDLLAAQAEVMGKGSFGTSYKAVLDVGTVAVVKRLKDVRVSESEFREKIEIVGSMEHENIVPLRAYYFNRDEKLLIYDYMPMLSLSALLHGDTVSDRTTLNWNTRCGIARGAARGIEYLHSRANSVSHGNINGYRAPEVTDPQGVSKKADIYSFGVLLLELLTGKVPICTLLNDEDGVDLVRWVKSVTREEWTSEVFDLELLRYQNAEEDMVKLLQLALSCAAEDPDTRPSISEVVWKIDELYQSSLQEEL